MKRKLAANFFVPGIPLPQGDKKMAPSGAPITFLSLGTMKGGFVIGTHPKTGNRCGWRARLTWKNKKQLMAWRGKIAHAARLHWQGDMLDGPVWLGCVFTFPRLKGHYNSKGQLSANAPTDKDTLPDLDKLMRAVGDALEIDAKIIQNDARIVGYVGQPHKRWGNHPGAQISIYVPESD